MPFLILIYSVKHHHYLVSLFLVQYRIVHKVSYFFYSIHLLLDNYNKNDVCSPLNQSNFLKMKCYLKFALSLLSCLIFYSSIIASGDPLYENNGKITQATDGCILLVICPVDLTFECDEDGIPAPETPEIINECELDYDLQFSEIIEDFGCESGQKHLKNSCTH